VFLVDNKLDGNPLPAGVHYCEERGKYVAQISNRLRSIKNLGRYNTPEEAHQAWKAKKHEYACQLAELETDERVKQALKTRYL
jgi:hypothetical protein